MGGNNSSADTALFIFMLSFWTLLTVFSYFFHAELAGQKIGSDISDLTYGSDTSALADSFNVLDWLENIPIIQYVVPLLKIIFWQYPEVPALMNIFIDMFAIISAYLLVTFVTRIR